MIPCIVDLLSDFAPGHKVETAVTTALAIKESNARGHVVLSLPQLYMHVPELKPLQANVVAALSAVRDGVRVTMT
jgi:hypothetical protein